ncbi:helix-turn-helix domain-containing protein [Hymenobacter sp. 5317J-9]|uniref:helix-turn-helix transcriptional regulator n=1 Tax=Hymenobacter sp. 5317J-9 TaxID=2932250 RepID=UPI001FD6F033|nr:helix-turn-helix transcriptional regulator [Hymenobacter sp. 5317J-9]UOQ99511.1 helix-turn-helix domain-containing protein [Hymenobacter sp. 5317J-9]
MPRKSISSNTLMQAVRRYFGLEQQELATYLGVTRAHVAHVEAGRRTLSSALLLRLTPLARHLPAESENAPALTETLPSSAPAPDAQELEWRQHQCRHRAGRLRRELVALHQRAIHAERWAAAHPEGPAHAATLTPADVARYHLLRLQAEALETEAAALASLLEPARNSQFSAGADAGT